MKGYIYKHTSPFGKSYIGQTTQKDPGMRWRNGRGYLSTTSYGEQTYFARAIKKYGWKNFTHEILWEGEVSSIEELNQLEEDFILREGTLAPDGYNLKTGGKNHIATEETRERMKKNHVGTLGKKYSAESRKRMSESQKLIDRHYPLSEETKKKISESNKGQKPTEFCRKRASESNKGKVVSKETREKMSQAKLGKTPCNKGISKYNSPEYLAMDSNQRKVYRCHLQRLGRGDCIPL